MRFTFNPAVLILSILFLIPEGYSAPCYGTRMPDKDQAVMGFQSYSLLNRHLEAEWGEVRSFQNFYLLTYGLKDWLSLDLKAGFGNIKQRPRTSAEIDYPTAFAGGYGFRIKLYEDKDKGCKSVCGFQHISVHPHHREANGVKNRAILDDWQASLLFSQKFGPVTPYLGTKFSRVDYIHWIGDNRKRRMSDLTQSWGAVLGLDIPLNEKTFINLEGHAFDEEAFSAAILYEF